MNKNARKNVQLQITMRMITKEISSRRVQDRRMRVTVCSGNRFSIASSHTGCMASTVTNRGVVEIEIMGIRECSTENGIFTQ